MRKTEKYEKPSLTATFLDMDSGFMSMSMDDLSTDSEQKSKTQKFYDGQYNEIY